MSALSDHQLGAEVAMYQSKTNLLDVLFILGLATFWGAIPAVLFYHGAIVESLITVLPLFGITWMLIERVRRGLRLPTRWECFRAWMNMRSVILLVTGIGALISFVNRGDKLLNFFPPLMILVMFVSFLVLWIIVLSYTLWRAPRRHETDSAFRRRVGYRE